MIIYDCGKVLIILAYADVIPEGSPSWTKWDGYLIRTLNQETQQIEEWWTPCLRGDSLVCPD